MGRAMGGTELSSLPLAPKNRDRLLRAGFRTLRDVEGIQPLDLSRGAVYCCFCRWIFLEVYVVRCRFCLRVLDLLFAGEYFSGCTWCAAVFFCVWIFREELMFASWNVSRGAVHCLFAVGSFSRSCPLFVFAVGYFLEAQQCTAVCHWVFLKVQYIVQCCLRFDISRGASHCCFYRWIFFEVQ